MVIKVSPIQYMMMCELGYTSDRDVIFSDDSGIYLERWRGKRKETPYVDPEGEFLDQKVSNQEWAQV